MQVKDIPDGLVMNLIAECNNARCDYSRFAYPDRMRPGYHGGRPGYGEGEDDPPKPHRATRFDLQVALSHILGVEISDNLLLAKLRKMKKQGKIEGCACGCRGDFAVPVTLESLKPYPLPEYVDLN